MPGLTSTKEGRREYMKQWRARVYRTRKPGHDNCMKQSCCYQGLCNYKRVAQAEYYKNRKKNK